MPVVLSIAKHLPNAFPAEQSEAPVKIIGNVTLSEAKCPLCLSC
jgi:hypothetical protein